MRNTRRWKPDAATMRWPLALAAVLSLAACFEEKAETSADSTYAEARETAAKLKGDDQGAASENALCTLFKPKELETYIGEPLAAPENAAMGSGCQWLAKDGEGDILIQIVPAAYHEPHRSANGHRAVAELGEDGFVEQIYDGWSAGAIVGEESVIAMVAGEKASDAAAIALHKEVVKRRAHE